MSPPPFDTWSEPDGDGIITRILDVGAASTLRGRRKRKHSQRRSTDLSLWPSAWRELLRDWLRQGGTRRKWAALLKTAGGRRVDDAWQLFDALLKAGMIEVEECREGGRWQPLWVEFADGEEIRELVGLSNRLKWRELREGHSGFIFQNGFLSELAETLAGMPAERAVRRHRLLVALDRWIGSGNSGTRRDFALFAAGDTKGITAAEWDWLEEGLCLEKTGISRHTPALWMRAPLALTGADGSLSLYGVPDCIGLTPETIERTTLVEGRVERWRILENRTVFERVARRMGSVDGVLWVPGFAPSWWKKSVARLLELCPAPALVACDPDPAGIEIALDVGAVWSDRKLSWEPWHMDAGILSSLKKRKPLNEDDAGRLQRLLARPLPEILRNLSLRMLEIGEKGEQEGISF